MSKKKQVKNRRFTSGYRAALKDPCLMPDPMYEILKTTCSSLNKRDFDTLKSLESDIQRKEQDLAFLREDLIRQKGLCEGLSRLPEMIESLSEMDPLSSNYKKD